MPKTVGRAGYVRSYDIGVFGSNFRQTVTQNLTGPPSGLTPPTWTGSGAYSGTRLGVAAGLGAEWLFFSNWSATFEYLHYDLGSFNCGVSCNGFIADNVKFSADAIRGGINFRF